MPSQHAATGTPVLADVLPDLPQLPVDGETSQLDAKGRFTCAAARTLLGRQPHDLAAHNEGHWVVLTPTGERTTARSTARFRGVDDVAAVEQACAEELEARARRVLAGPGRGMGEEWSVVRSRRG